MLPTFIQHADMCNRTYDISAIACVNWQKWTAWLLTPRTTFKQTIHQLLTPNKPNKWYHHQLFNALINAPPKPINTKFKNSKVMLPCKHLITMLTEIHSFNHLSNTSNPITETPFRILPYSRGSMLPIKFFPNLPLFIQTCHPTPYLKIPIITKNQPHPNRLRNPMNTVFHLPCGSSIHPKPPSPKDSLTILCWTQVIEEELSTLHQNSTWTFVPQLPKYECRWLWMDISD